MLSFKRFLAEQNSIEPDAHHAEMYFWDDGGKTDPLYRLIKTSGKQTTGNNDSNEPMAKPNKIVIDPALKINEGGKGYRTDEPTDTIDDNLHKVIGEFTPSSYDHDTIAREFHHHLYKNGYYMHTDSHPLVMGPADQAFKSGFKKQIARKRAGKEVSAHELPHQDGSPSRNVPPGGLGIGRFVGLWSTRGSTNVYPVDTKKDPKTGQLTKGPIEGATSDNYVSIIDDSRVKHAASGEINRWFLRAGEIRRIPPTGLVSPSGKQYGNDIESYINDKRHNLQKHRRDIKDYFNDRNGNKSTPEEKARTLQWIKDNHPKFDPTSNPNIYSARHFIN